ncbi:hypothetical protein [Methanosarcina barkeri]|uniref:Guanylate cyclase domain-containing protein n=1 Tax=Methanosarcina barkeri CM1 TaxID=796385 RepID=A0A0G3CGK3_METBA|nr:hypothetical protein [Methanosarcina barkeri]AKJ39875.1 hypothetical protein MCM1_2879 [Methanosarcina barkeri CM1]
MIEETKKPIKTGVVTFLDVLGWKGVYNRKTDAIISLTNLVEGVSSLATRQRGGKLNSDTLVKSISDTIAIFTPCTEEEFSIAIDIHGLLCQWIIPHSIEAEIPVRGATAFGEFEIKDSIFVGKAVDEAASWHEQSDWIGVHLTPSAEYLFNVGSNPRWIEFTPPSKTPLKCKLHCVNWIPNWQDETKDRDIEYIKEKFRRLGPIVPELAGKFANTLQFIKDIKAKNSPDET